MHNYKQIFWGTLGHPWVRFPLIPTPLRTTDTRTSIDIQYIEPLFDIDIYDLDIFVRLIRFIRLHILDCMHRLQPRKDAPKDRVFLVEPRRRIRSDEELGSVSVRTCVRHTHGIRPVKKWWSDK
jgi:hypothetical protein